MSVLFLVLKIITGILLFILISICVIMFVPFEYSTNGKLNDGLDGEVKVKWLFGGLSAGLIKKPQDKVKAYLKLCGIKFNMPLQKTDKVKKKHKKEHDNKKKKSLKGITTKLKGVITKKVINIIYNYFKDILHIVAPKVIKINGTYGFSNPAITGCLCGFISIVNEVVSSSDINLEPDFNEEVLDIEVEIKGTIFMCVIAFKTLVLLLRKEVRKIIFAKRSKKLKLLNS